MHVTRLRERADHFKRLAATARKTSSESCVLDVTVHVASKNTRVYTELCLRSMWRLAGASFQLVVGDCSSEDGSQKCLRRMAADGLLTLQELPADTSHSDWIDRWRNECRTKYFVLVDSDVEFLEPNWLPRLLAALGSRSMLSYGVEPEMRYRETRFEEPFEYLLLTRPDPCVLVLDHARTQMINASFVWREEAYRWPPEKAYDVGGYFAKTLEEEGHSWAAMPTSVHNSFNHFGGRSWTKWSRRRGIRYLLLHVRLEATIVLLRVLDRVRPTKWSSGRTPS